LAKNVFQVHGVDASGAVVLRRQLRRGQVEKFFAQLPPALVGLEACGSAHHWGRVIASYGHEVRLMPPGYVKPYVKRNKNDGRDAEAICEAVSRPTMRFVPVKSVEQQAALSVHGARSLLVRQRTMVANALRAMLSEIGIVAAQGLKGLRELMGRLAQPSEGVPELMRAALLVLARQWETLDVAERALERQIKQAAAADQDARRLMQVPSVGPIIASAVVAKVADARAFRSGRDFAAWIGLRHRRQVAPGGDLQAGRPHAAGAADLWCQRLSAPGAPARRHRSMAARVAGAAALQGRHGSTRGQDRPHHLGDAGNRRTLPRSRARPGPSLRGEAGPRALNRSERANPV
jgi:transposase